MKPIIYLCLAILPISLGATGISIAFMPMDSGYKPGDFITEFITHHASWPTAKALFFSYIIMFSGIILAIKYFVSLSSKSDS